MKCCHIGLRWSSKVAGGAERIFSELAAGLPDVGVQFIGAVAGTPGLRSETHGLIRSFAPEDSGTLTRLRGAHRVIGDLLSEESPNILASHFALYTLPILKRLADRPFVMHFHGPWAMESRVEGGSASATFAKKQIERVIYQRADRAIVLSKAFAGLLRHEYGVPEEKISIVPGAVDLDRFTATPSRAEARGLLDWPADRPILLTVRRLVHRMGLQQLIDALPGVRERVPDVLLLIAGTGPIRSELEHRVRERGLEFNVRFLGFVPEEMLSLAYRGATLSVVPTVSLEGFGLVAAESLAAGTPAMVTPVGGLPEVVEDLSKDLLFRSGDPADLSDGLVNALTGNKSLPSEASCRAYAEAKFSRKLMVTRTASIYDELIH